MPWRCFVVMMVASVHTSLALWTEKADAIPSSALLRRVEEAPFSGADIILPAEATAPLDEEEPGEQTFAPDSAAAGLPPEMMTRSIEPSEEEPPVPALESVTDAAMPADVAADNADEPSYAYASTGTEDIEGPVSAAETAPSDFEVDVPDSVSDGETGPDGETESDGESTTGGGHKKEIVDALKEQLDLMSDKLSDAKDKLADHKEVKAQLDHVAEQLSNTKDKLADAKGTLADVKDREKTEKEKESDGALQWQWTVAIFGGSLIVALGLTRLYARRHGKSIRLGNVVIAGSDDVKLSIELEGVTHQIGASRPTWTAWRPTLQRLPFVLTEACVESGFPELSEIDLVQMFQEQRVNLSFVNIDGQRVSVDLSRGDSAVMTSELYTAKSFHVCVQPEK